MHSYTERQRQMRCYGKDAQEPFDIAVLGAPFDTSTTFRPGARFGPNAIRQGSRRIQKNGFSYNVPMRFDPLKDESAPVVIDCGDIPMSLFDNKLALEQLQQGYGSLLHRRTITKHSGKTSLAKDGKFHPRIIALGGVSLSLRSSSMSFAKQTSQCHDSYYRSRTTL